MIPSQSNRVRAIKNRFENLNPDDSNANTQLYKHRRNNASLTSKRISQSLVTNDNDAKKVLSQGSNEKYRVKLSKTNSFSAVAPNTSYLYTHIKPNIPKPVHSRLRHTENNTDSDKDVVDSGCVTKMGVAQSATFEEALDSNDEDDETDKLLENIENVTPIPEIPESQSESSQNIDSSSQSDFSTGNSERTDLMVKNQTKHLLARQASDPCKKLQRSHAFRCDRSQKICHSPKRHNSCGSRNDNEPNRIEKPRLSKERLKKLGNFLEDQMRKENFISNIDIQRKPGANRNLNSPKNTLQDSVPDSEVPQHILDQYAKVLKPRKETEDIKFEAMTDSGVSSETELNSDEPEKIKFKRLQAQFEQEKTDFKILRKSLSKSDDTLLDDKDNCPVANLINFKNENISASSETIVKLQKKNPDVVLTDTLKKALKQPLPPGPPPKKPPRTFAALSSPESPEIPNSPPLTTEKKRKDSKQMLEKLELALQKHQESKFIQPRQKNIYDIAESNSSAENSPNLQRENKPKKSKEIHYLCTEILDITHRTLLPNTENISTSLTNCFNSLNCVQNRPTSSIGYARLSSASNSDRNSVSNICCTCSANSMENLSDLAEKNKFSTFFGTKPVENICRNCTKNTNNHVHCHLNCNTESDTRSFDQMSEHVYAEPFIRPKTGKSNEVQSEAVLSKVKKSVKKWEDFENTSNSSDSVYGVLNNVLDKFGEKPGEPTTHEEEKIYDIPCEISRSPSPDIEIRPRNFDVLRRSFEVAPVQNDFTRKSLRKSIDLPPRPKTLDLKKTKIRNTAFSESLEDVLKASNHDNASDRYRIEVKRDTNAANEKSSKRNILSQKKNENVAKNRSLYRRSSSEQKLATINKGKSPDGSKFSDNSKPPIEKSKPVFVKVPSDSKLKFSCMSRSSDNLADKEFANIKKCLDRRIAADGRKTKFEKSRSHGSINRVADPKQLDVDRENLNKLMSEIYETVSAACVMDEAASGAGAKPSRFPVDCDGTSSEESIKLTRSMTEKRKSYVRRVNSKVAYLDPNTRPNVRYRHQTSVCSYKSENLDNNYATFRSWKSFKNSQGNLRKSSSFVKHKSIESPTDVEPKLRKNRASDTKLLDFGDKCSRKLSIPKNGGAHDELAVDKTNSLQDINNLKQSPNQSLDSIELADKRLKQSDSKANLTDSKGNLLALSDEISDWSGDEISTDMDDQSIDRKAGCIDIVLPSDKENLFDICILVGLNHMTGQAYVKSVFPEEMLVPPHIENLVFPETLSGAGTGASASYDLESTRTQRYSLVVTNEKGERSFGYCRRVLPEGASFCLPLAYCLIAKFRAPGFYNKVLKEIESLHGSTEDKLSSVLRQLYESDFPQPGESVAITLIKTPKKADLSKNSLYRNSVNLGDILKCKTLPDKKMNIAAHIPDFYDLENNNTALKCMTLNESAGSAVLGSDLGNDLSRRLIKRSIEPRLDEDNIAILVDVCGPSLLIKVFASLLLERKVIIVADNLSKLSSCMEGLQAILYPFVWQQPLISAIPGELRKDILEAPLPILAGLLTARNEALDFAAINFEEGILVEINDKSQAKIIRSQGDESTILPSSCYKTLKTTLQLESARNCSSDIEKTRNVLISEAFLRFFVEVLSEFWSHVVESTANDGHSAEFTFERESFIKSAKNKQIEYFLEWFTETSIFNHFLENMTKVAPHKEKNRENCRTIDYNSLGLLDTPYPNFYEVFEERLSQSKKKSSKGDLKCQDKSSYRSVIKKVKNRLKDLVS